MRIVYITPLYLPWVGGLEVICSQLLAELRQRGHDVAVITAVNDTVTPLGLVEIEGIPVLRADPYRAIGSQSPSELLRVRRQVSSFVEDFGADVVHAHDPSPLLWIYQRLAPRRRPLILTIHVVLSRHDPSLLQAAVKLMHEVDWVTGVSDDVVNDILSYAPALGDRISMVRNGARPPGPPPGPLPDGPVELLCVGRLVTQKGFDLALDALAILVRERKDIHLSIAGEGPCFNDLAAQIERLGLSEHATLLGRVEHDRIGELMAASTIVVMPSRWEGLPLVVLEAAHMERPVVGTDAPGLGSAIEDGVTGLVVPEEDSESLAGALIRLIDDRDEARAIGRRARAAALRNSSIGACADQYERLYERFAGLRVA